MSFDFYGIHHILLYIHYIKVSEKYCLLNIMKYILQKEWCKRNTFVFIVSTELWNTLKFRWEQRVLDFIMYYAIAVEFIMKMTVLLNFKITQNLTVKLNERLALVLLIWQVILSHNSIFISAIIGVCMLCNESTYIYIYIYIRSLTWRVIFRELNFTLEIQRDNYYQACES